MACKHMTSCELYAQFKMKSSLRIWQLQYCDQDERYERCARYQAALGAEPVPITLLPNGKHLTAR